MEFNQVQINKAENGFIVASSKVVFGQQHPEQAVNVFKTFDEVIAFLAPTKVKLQTV